MMSLFKYSNQRGNALILVMISASIGAILLTALSKQVSMQYRAERGIASNLDMTELSRLVTMAIGEDYICAKTGLLNLDLTSLVPVEESTSGSTQLRPTVPVSLAIGQQTLAANTVFNQTRNIHGLSLVNLSPTAEVGTYIGTLKLTTSVTGKAVTARDPEREFQIKLKLDASNRVIACGGPVAPNQSPSASPGPGSSGGGEMLAVAGTPWARTLNDRSSGWLPIGRHSESYTVPVGKNLIIHMIEPDVNRGWIDCTVAVDGDDYAAANKREGRDGFNSVALTNAITFGGGTTIRYGGETGSGSTRPSRFSCRFLGVLVDAGTEPAPSFKGFEVAHVRSRVNNSETYTVPAGKNFVLLNMLGSAFDADSVYCTLQFGGGGSFEYEFGVNPGEVVRAIPRPIAFKEGTRITFRTDLNSPGFLDIGHCSWIGQEIDAN